MNVYEQIKNAKNPSPRTQAYFKKHPFRRVWAIGNEGESLIYLKSKGLRTCLRLGNPEFVKASDFGKSKGRVKAFTGRRFSSVLTGQREGDCYLVNLKGSWAIDVTELFIEQYNKFGMCALHDERHEFKSTGKRSKACVHCGAKYVSKTVIKKEVKWTKKK